ncbi:hypothetical protein M426DRAFT_230004 [Hypoxylon sp. CI-4A]|nr:hypothetical protein M426DRAFT_230004 [Hypoxylon sp. CI-4A]
MWDGMDNFSGFSNVGDGWHTNSSSGYSSGFSQAASDSNTTYGTINQFKFLAAKSIRNSTIILAAFNAVSAFATAAGIYYDCYTARKRAKLAGKEKVNVFRCIGSGPETFPFILALGIMVQGIIFAIVQSFGLDGFFLAGCSLVSQFTWPAIFIVPYIQLVFGLEVTLRALKSRPFPPRSKWNVAICLAIVKVLTLATGLVGYFVRPPTFCFASLFWFVARWAEGGFVILVIVIVVLVICSIIIFTKLTRYSIIEEDERVSTSRMVYYLTLAIVTNALIVPFFVYLTFLTPMDSTGDLGLTLSMISTVVANVTGLTNGGLHLFLRSNTIGNISPKKELAEFERKQQKMLGSNGMDFNDHLRQPVPGPSYLSKTESQEYLVDEKVDVERGDMVNPLRSNAVFDAADIPQPPEPVLVPPTPTANTHSRKPSASYTLFPGRNQNKTSSVALLPSTTYNPNPQPDMAAFNFPFSSTNDNLLPPPPIRSSFRHRRNSSMSSSATVQIGLRISNVADIGPMAGKASTEIEREYAENYPQNLPLPNPYRPSPLAMFKGSNNSTPLSPVPSRDTERSPSPSSIKSDDEKSNCTLSPKVYDPNSPTKSKTPSPRGVGFNVPRRANTTPIQKTPTPPPSRNRGNSSSVADNGSGWI